MAVSTVPLRELHSGIVTASEWCRQGHVLVGQTDKLARW